MRPSPGVVSVGIEVRNLIGGIVLLVTWKILAGLQIAVSVELVGIGEILIEHRLSLRLGREVAAVVEIFLGFVLIRLCNRGLGSGRRRG